MLKNEIGVSRNTILNDLQELKSWFEDREMTLKAKPHVGYVIEATETQIRENILKLMEVNSEEYYQNGYMLNVYWWLLLKQLDTMNSFENLKNILLEEEEETGVILEDYSFYEAGIELMIILKIIIAICLFSGIFFFFWYLQRTKIIEKGLATVRGSIEETAARRQIEAHATLLIRDQKNKGRLEKIIERPEQLYIYSRIGKIVKGLSFEVWAVLIVLTAAGAYVGTVIITKNTMTGLLAAAGYYLIIKIVEMILARRNFKTLD